MKLYYLLLIPVLTLLSCDPAHTGYFENGSEETIILEIPEYRYKLRPGILIGSYPEMTDIELSDQNITLVYGGERPKLRIILESHQSVLVSYDLGVRPGPPNDVEYTIFVASDTISLSEKEIFIKMKKRDRDRFKYYYKFEK